jgi:hypothetical protein
VKVAVVEVVMRCCRVCVAEAVCLIKLAEKVRSSAMVTMMMSQAQVLLYGGAAACQRAEMRQHKPVVCVSAW